jgi:subtilisin family serine protease
MEAELSSVRRAGGGRGQVGSVLWPARPQDRLIACLLLVLLAGCGGGSASSPPGAPSPGNPGSGSGSGPTLTPAQFETAEYNASWGLGAIGASSAYAHGATGAGVPVGIVDTGIDRNHPEFAARLHPDSIDIVTGSAATLDDAYGHGTLVAGIVGAARDGVGMHGVAFESPLLVVRADTPGSCEVSCTFGDAHVAQATSWATAKGARVINYSLGGNGPLSPTLESALKEAAAAGVILVFAAGNGGGEDPVQPAVFAVEDGAGGLAIAVGAVDRDREIASFSNRAGVARDHYLVAPGVGVASTWPDGGYASASGTSVAAPHVAGAAALVLQLWPHLDPRDVVAILLESAADLGAPGVDEVYGQGMLDLEAALAPLGPLALPGGAALEATGLALGPAFGDALARHPVPAVALDGYGRDFRLDLGGRVTEGAGPSWLGSWLVPVDGLAMARVVPGLGRLEAGLVADRRLARRGDGRLTLDHATVTLDLRPGTTLTLAEGTGLAPGTAGLGARRAPHAALAGEGRVVRLDHDGGGLRLGAGLAAGSEAADGPLAAVRRHGVVLDLAGEVPFGLLGLRLGAVRERGGLLGARGGGGFGLDGALTRFAAIDLTLPLDARTTLTAHGGLGRTTGRARGGLIGSVGPLTSTAFGLALSREDLVTPVDRTALAVARPLRVERGSAVLDLPTGRDARERRRVDLSPSGHTVEIELAHERPLAGGRLGLGMLVELFPAHDAAARPHLAAGIRWRASR